MCCNNCMLFWKENAKKDEFETLSKSELESSELIDEDEIYHQVVGKERHGRVRGFELDYLMMGAKKNFIDMDEGTLKIGMGPQYLEIVNIWLGDGTTQLNIASTIVWVAR
ncbi:hypothetical protein CRYUN_Cryun01aG0070300 [Craigia yunnanensis]